MVRGDVEAEPAQPAPAANIARPATTDAATLNLSIIFDILDFPAAGT
jgi:hypothetical protein